MGSNLTKKNIVSAIVIILVIAAVAGIYVLKNYNRNNENNLNIIQSGDVQESGEGNNFQPLALTKVFDLEEIKSEELPILIDFGADYCAPCRQMEPALKKVYEDTKGKAIVRFVDVENYPEVAAGYPIELIPTQMLFNNDGTPYAPENAEELDLVYYNNLSGDHALTLHIGMLSEESMKQMLKEMGMNE